MTELQILRNSLFDELSRIKRGSTTMEDTKSVVSVGNSIIQTFNTELKSAELVIKAKELGVDTKAVEIFKDSDKEALDYKAKDEKDL